MFYTYIMASRRNGTLYTGSTDDLPKWVFSHKEAGGWTFTTKYNVNMLVWFESHESRNAAFKRERQIMEWRRVWKLRLIEETNPDWRDLNDDLNNPLSF
jgi:putative endonuclease